MRQSCCFLIVTYFSRVKESPIEHMCVNDFVNKYLDIYLFFFPILQRRLELEKRIRRKQNTNPSFYHVFRNHAVLSSFIHSYRFHSYVIEREEKNVFTSLSH